MPHNSLFVTFRAEGKRKRDADVLPPKYSQTILSPLGPFRKYKHHLGKFKGEKNLNSVFLAFSPPSLQTLLDPASA